MLQEARAEFRQLLCDSSVRINALAKKLGSCVEKARPYYEARIKAKEVSCVLCICVDGQMCLFSLNSVYTHQE